MLEPCNVWQTRNSVHTNTSRKRKSRMSLCWCSGRAELTAMSSNLWAEPNHEQEHCVYIKVWRKSIVVPRVRSMGGWSVWGAYAVAVYNVPTSITIFSIEKQIILLGSFSSLVNILMHLLFFRFVSYILWTWFHFILSHSEQMSMETD